MILGTGCLGAAALDGAAIRGALAAAGLSRVLLAVVDGARGGGLAGVPAAGVRCDFGRAAQGAALATEARASRLVLDLPALGDDATPPAEASFEAGIEKIGEIIGARRNWTLVGHSLGGLYVTEAALRSSGKVRSVVYVAAYVPIAGDDWKTVDELAPAARGFKKCITRDEASQAFVLDAAKAKEFFYHDVAAGIGAAACSRLKPQPIDPVEHAKIDGSAEALKKIPRSAIVAEEDRVLPPEKLVALAERAQVPFEMVGGGHCPFLSQPKRIADLLLGVK